MQRYENAGIPPNAGIVNRLLTIVRYMLSKQSKIVGFFKKSVEDSISEEELLSSDNENKTKAMKMINLAEMRNLMKMHKLYHQVVWHNPQQK